MILQCKNCNARYLVPDHAIGADGRTVRCARCLHTWFEAPVKPKEEAPLPDFDQIIGDINATAKPIPEGSNLPTSIAKTPTSLKAMVVAMVILAIITGLFILTPGLFGEHPSKGLVITDLEIKKQSDEETSVAEISGNIMNMGEDERTIPNIRVMLLDGANNPLQSWEFAGDGKKIAKNGVIPFTTGELNIKFTLAKRFVVDLGTPVELAMRRKPQ